MAIRAHEAMIYATMLAVSLAGLAKASLWAVVAGAAVLVLLLVFRRALSTEPIALSAPLTDATTALASVINGSAVASAAYILGQFSARLWGI